MIDLRSINKGAVYSLENAHSQPIRDLDFNPNRQYLMATGGDDGCTKFWDIRNIQSPVLSRQDHFHWYVLSWCKDLAQHYANILFFFLGYGKWDTTCFTISWYWQPAAMLASSWHQLHQSLQNLLENSLLTSTMKVNSLSNFNKIILT